MINYIKSIDLVDKYIKKIQLPNFILYKSFFFVEINKRASQN